jgi:hypothetical protein
MRADTVAVLSLLAALTVAPTAQARFITIEANVNAGIEGATATIAVNVANRGDEAAHNVVARADIGGAVQTGHLRGTLLPNERYSETFNTAVEYQKPGRYPVIVTVEYTDGNQYPFSALSIVHLDYGDTVAGRVVGELGSVSIGSGGSVTLNVRNLGQTHERLTARLVTPGELSAAPATRAVRLKPNEKKSLAFKVRNASALSGSQYQVYALLDYEQDNYHFSNVVGGQIAVKDSEDALAGYTAPLIAVTVVAGGVLVYVNRRKRPRGTPAS